MEINLIVGNVLFFFKNLIFNPFNPEKGRLKNFRLKIEGLAI